MVPFATGYNEFLGSNRDCAFSVLDSNRTILSVGPRNDSTISFVSPPPDEFSFEPPNMWFVWDIGSRVGYKRWVNSAAVMLEFEDNPSIQKEKANLFLAGLFLGTGTSVSVAAFFETLKVLTETGIPERRLNLGCIG